MSGIHHPGLMGCLTVRSGIPVRRVPGDHSLKAAAANPDALSGGRAGQCRSPEDVGVANGWSWSAKAAHSGVEQW